MEKQNNWDSIFGKIIFWLIFIFLNVGTFSTLKVFYETAICLFRQGGLCEGPGGFFGPMAALIVFIPSLIMDYFLIKNRRSFFKNKFIVFFLLVATILIAFFTITLLIFTK